MMHGVARHLRAPLRGALALLTAVVLGMIPILATPLGAAEAASAAIAEVQQPTQTALPDQSSEPAPASRIRERHTIGNVHTDTVSAFVDDGKLVLSSKYDDPGPPAQTGVRIDPLQHIFHLADTAASRQTVPAAAPFRFLGAPGETVWIAPQVQNAQLIWPGFSTEDPALSAALGGGQLTVRLLGVDGPGRAELYQSGDDGPERRFSSGDALPEWQMGARQHSHMSWAFSERGTYVFTFEVEAMIGGSLQTARNDYTFVVGSLDEHFTPGATETALAVEATTDADGYTVEGSDVTLTATVTGGGARAIAGAVEFRAQRGAEQDGGDGAGVLLGHAPVDARGQSAFRTAALPPGAYDIVATFVPTWGNELARSQSAPGRLLVGGEIAPRPADRAPREITADELAAAGPRTTVRAGGEMNEAGDPEVVAGTDLLAVLDRESLFGKWVYAWVQPRSGDATAGADWVFVLNTGSFSLPVPADAPTGPSRVIVLDEDDTLVGWDDLTVVGPPAEDPGTGVQQGPQKPPAGQESGDRAAAAVSAAESSARAVTQSCTPDVTLDRGHIDAFNVAVANGTAVLQIKEDVTGHNRIREAETVLLRVKEEALGPVPSGIAGAPSRGYMLPLTEDPHLIWPGWNTQGFVEYSGYRDVSIHIRSVDGPGRIFMGTQGSFNAWSPVLTNGYALPGTIRVPQPAHTHAAWVFSEPGIYKLSVQAVATHPGTGHSLTTATHTYVFQVGNVPLGDAFCGVSVDPGAANAGRAVTEAVRAAGLEALAEARSANQAAAVPTVLARQTRTQSEGPVTSLGEILELLTSGDLRTGNAALMISGGALMVGGIVGGTVWYLRRLSTAGAAAAGATPVPGGKQR